MFSNANDDKRIQSNNSIETWAYGTNEEITPIKRENMWINTIEQYKNDISCDNINPVLHGLFDER